MTGGKEKKLLNGADVATNDIKKGKRRKVMKTLRAIQVLAKIGKIISKIIFICCIVGACGCVAGLIALAFGVYALEINGYSLEVILIEQADITLNTLWTAIASSIPLCIGECVVAKFAERYFDKELKRGTPFDYGIAKETLKLGILIIAIPLAALIIAEITQAIMASALANVVKSDYNEFASFGLGAAFIVLSLIFKHGAELAEYKSPQNEIKEEKNEKD